MADEADEVEPGPEPESVPEPAPPPINTTVTVDAGDSDMNKYIPIYILTGVFGAIFVFGPLLVRKGPNKQIIRVCIMMSAFCMYLFWVTAYIAQMNPLTGPRLHNTTVAWYQYKFGKHVAWPKEYTGNGSDDYILMFELDPIDNVDFDNVDEAEPARVSSSQEAEPPTRALTKSKPKRGTRRLEGSG